MQEEAKILEFFVQEPASNNGLDKAARCTNPGKIHVYAELMGRGTLFVSTLSSITFSIAHTCMEKCGANFR